MAKHTFIFTDDSVINSHGFRVLTKGGQFDEFNTNPLVLWMHRRPSKYKGENSDDDVFPIGLGSNVRIKNGQGLVDIEFDSKDPFAQKIEQKVESGIIRMASAGIEPISWTDDPKFLLPGQKYATLTEWKLTEISIVDIGSNPMALKLYNSNKEIIELTAGNQQDFIPLLKNKNQEPNMELLHQVAVKLGKQADASVESVMETLNDTIKLAKEAADYKGKYETLLGEVQLATEKSIISLVDDAVVKTRITADKKDFYVKLGKDSGIDSLRTVLDSMPVATTTKDILLGKGKGEIPGAEGEVKTFDQLKAKGMEAVELCKKDTPTVYIALFKEAYGFEPKMD